MKFYLSDSDIDSVVFDLRVLERVETNGEPKLSHKVYKKAVKLWLQTCLELIQGNPTAYALKKGTVIAAAWDKAKEAQK